MTKIKILGDRIIFDGHAETKQECETITLLCDNLAKSVDFKTIKYESGYAEFEKIGNIKNVKDLMFVPSMADLTINWDSHIQQVTVTTTYGTATWTYSGETITNTISFENSIEFTVTLDEGWILDTGVVTDDSGIGSVTINSDNTFVSHYLAGGGAATLTLTSKQDGASKKTIDVSTLSGWESLASGDHSITVKTKASGYLDSASSNAVTVSKAVSGYSVTFTDNTNGFLQENGWFYSTDNGETWIDISTLSNLTINGISQIKFKVNNKPSLYSGIDEANYVSITSQSLGVDITAYRNRDPIMSDNYTLSADVSDVVLYAMPD